MKALSPKSIKEDLDGLISELIGSSGGEILRFLHVLECLILAFKMGSFHGLMVQINLTYPIFL